MAAVALAALLLGAPGATQPTPPEEHVTVIGDSVATGMTWNAQALAILGDGFDLDLEVAVCRRLVGVSCPFEGSRAPTLLDVVAELGPRVGGTVVVVAGYNEPEQTFPDAVERSLAALTRVGATRILWASLSERRADYARMNIVLAEAAARHPELTIVPWGKVSLPHNGWFQGDGVHLTPTGGVALAQLLHAALEGQPMVDPTASSPGRLHITPRRMPRGHAGRPYRLTLAASGGTAPYRWRSTKLPAHLHLSASGVITGVPLRPVRESVRLTVVDSKRNSGSMRVTLVVGG